MAIQVERWRWGSETDRSALAAQDTQLTGVDLDGDTAYILEVQLYSTKGGGADPYPGASGKFQYSTNKSTWYDVGGTNVWLAVSPTDANYNDGDNPIDTYINSSVTAEYSEEDENNDISQGDDKISAKNSDYYQIALEANPSNNPSGTTTYYFRYMSNTTEVPMKTGVEYPNFQTETSSAAMYSGRGIGRAIARGVYR